MQGLDALRVHRAVSDDRNDLGIFERVRDEGLELGEFDREMVPYELVDQDYLSIDGRRQTIRLGQEVVFGMIFDVANIIRCLLMSRLILEVCDFLQGSDIKSQGCCSEKEM